MDVASFRSILGLFRIMAVSFAVLPPALAALTGNNMAGRSGFAFEFLRFKAGAGELAMLEIFCQIPARGFQFFRLDDRYAAHYRIDMEISDVAGNEVLASAYQDSIYIDSYEDRYKLTTPALVRIVAYLPSGSFKARVRVTDQETDTFFTFDKDLEIPDYRRHDLSLSDVQVSARISTTDSDGVLVKNGRTIYPNTSRIFGAGLDTLFVYSEVYHLSESDSVGKFSVTYFIKNDSEEDVRTILRIYQKPATECAVSIGIPIDDLPSGNYKLVLRIKDLDSRETAMMPAHFTIVSPQIEDFPDDVYATLLRQLSLIARPGEITKLKSAPREERVSSIRKFWQSKDPAQGSGINEFKREFYRRLEFANQNFFNFLGEGWESDQGRTYIQHGAPDYIDDLSTGYDSNESYQVWFYSHSNKRFYFVDDGNFGEYRIVENFDTIREISFH